MTEHQPDVPPRPAFVLRVRNDASGAPTAWLDDERLTVPPGLGVHRALIRAARRRADRTQPGRTIRVVGMTPDGTAFHLAIGPDGEAWEVPPPEENPPAENPPAENPPEENPPEENPPAEAPREENPSEQDGAPPDVVPDEVAHVVELQEQGDRLVGLVDGEQVPLESGEDPYDQLLREARRRADEHAPGRTVRALGRTPGGRVWHVALTPDGTPQVVAPVPAKPAASQRPGERPSGPVNAFRPAAPADDEPVRDEPARDEPARDDRARDDRARDEAGDSSDDPVDTSHHTSPGLHDGSGQTPDHAVIPADEPEPQPAYAPEHDYQPTEHPAPGGAALTDDLGRPIPTTTTLAGSGRGFEAAGPGAEPVAARGTTDRPDPAPEHGPDGPSRRGLLLGGAGAVVLAGAAVAGFFAFRGNDGPTTRPTPSVAGTPLPDGIRSPAGLPSSYLWSVVKLSDVAPQLVVTDKQMACTVDNDTTGGTELISLDPQTGKSQWKADLPVDAVVSNGPALCPIDGVDTIVLTTQSQIMAYPLSGGEPKTWPLESKWSSALTTSGVIVTKPEDTGSAYILYGDRLTQRALPKNANPVAMLGDGTLVATDSQGTVWFSTDPTTAPAPQKLKAPAGTTPGTFVAATADQLITAFVPNDDPQASRLRAFSLPSLRPRITTAPIKPAVFPSTFMLAPDQSWAVAGNAWIDMRTGKSHVITAQWSPIAISQHNSWSKSGDNVLTATAQGTSLGPATQQGGQVTVPHGGTAKVAYCVASVGSDTTLYAVPLKG